MKKFFYLLVLIALGLSACSRSSIEPTPINYSYLPAELGKYIIYNVDSFIWDDFTKALSVRKSQMKYEYTDTFTDPAGRLTYVITITRKDDSTDFFVEDNVATLTLDGKAEFFQKGLKFIPLSFPLRDGKSWDGLAFINRDNSVNPQFSSLDWNYELQDVGKAYTVGSKEFKKTATVEHIDLEINDPDTEPDFYAEKVRSMEVYADSVGLVYKEFIYWVYQPLNEFPSGKGVKMTYHSSNW